MDEHEAILRYKTAMSVFKNWLTEGVINDADLMVMSAAIAKKHGLSSCSIFLENDLLCKEK